MVHSCGACGLISIIQGLLAEGPVPASEFMSLALYHPEHGYYRRGSANWGFDGKDYYTALDLGPLLGEAIARALQGAWLELDRPCPFTIFEPGAGRGWLGKDILNAAEGDFAQSIQYIHCDDSPAAQQEAMKALGLWLDSGHARLAEQSETIAPFAGAVISNELYDALPAQPWRWDGEKWEREVLVSLEGDGSGAAGWEAADPGEAGAWFAEHADGGLRPEDGSVWAGGLPNALGHVCGPLQKGVFLAIDYGDSAGRLIAKGAGLRRYLKHQVDGQWWMALGDSDLTADVDFTRLAHLLGGLGLRVERPVSLGRWIRENAPLDRWERRWQQLPPAGRAARTNNLLQLTMPDAMGDRFKVIRADAP